MQAKIVGENGEVVARGEKGELCIRGYCVMLCYWEDPEQTRKAIKEDGWYYTGYAFLLVGFSSWFGAVNQIISLFFSAH